MTGYQQAIMYLCGSYSGERFIVRNVDRHYVDAVADCFPGCHVYLQHHSDPLKKDYWCIKSARVAKPALSDVSDLSGFCRGFVELQGGITAYHVTVRGHQRYVIKLRVYGSADGLDFISRALPAAPKKIQHIYTDTGHTCSLVYQSKAEIIDILDYIDGLPQNHAIWDKWWEILNSNKKPEA